MQWVDFHFDHDEGGPNTTRKGTLKSIKQIYHSKCRLFFFSLFFFHSRSRMPSLPWFCAAMQNENQTFAACILNTNKLKAQRVPLLGQLSDGGTGRPVRDWTQRCLSACKRTLKLESVGLDPEGLNSFLRIQPPCMLFVFCLSSAQLSSAAGMPSCVHSSPYSHRAMDSE